MNLSLNNPKNIPAPVGGYSQSVQLSEYSNLVFISGQIGESPSGEIPADFEEQCVMVWTHISNLLQAVNMGFENLVKINTYLTGRDQVEINRIVRNRYLGDHRPALTVIIAQTVDPRWLLEIEAIAAI